MLRYILLSCLLAVLCGCSAKFAPESINHARAPDQPPLWRIDPNPPKEIDTERSAIDRAVEWISHQRYLAALELLDPIRRRHANLAKPAAGGDRPQQAEVLFWIAYCHEKLGQDDDAKPLYERVRDTFVDTRFAPLAQARLEVLEAATSDQ